MNRKVSVPISTIEITTSDVDYTEICTSYHRGEYDYIPKPCETCQESGLTITITKTPYVDLIYNAIFSQVFPHDSKNPVKHG